MKPYFRVLTLVFVVFLASGCQERIQPIYNPENVPVPQGLVFTSLEEVGKAIKQAGASKNWKMTDTGPGKIEGVLRIRTHKATVRIDYSLISYSITYVSSVNLLADSYGIHRNYNQWVRELEAAINMNLSALANTTKIGNLTSDDKTMLEDWKRVQNSSDPLALQEFMDTYSDGPFIGPAQDRLDLLAHRRVSGVKTFDPTGNWRVTVRYQRGSGNINACPKNARWSFILDFRRGKFSNTYWDGNLPLYLTGENYDDLVDLKLNGPRGSGDFEWTERFRLDSNEARFKAKTEGGCPGTMTLYMKKIDAVGGGESASGQGSGNYSGFDPTGNWQVIVRYLRGADNISACPNSGRWDFVLNFQRGKFSETHWDGTLPLYVEGQNFDDFVDLKLSGPLYSGEFEWTEKFRIDRNEEWFEAKADGACPGTMKLHMKKADTVGDISGASGQVSENYNGFDPTGTLQVFANYKSSSGASASCIQNVNWSFPLDFHRGIISKVVYSGRTALHLNGENNPGHVDLQINVPAGGTLWRWTERFVLDGPDKFFRAESPSGGGHYGQCHGVISMRMQKTN
ncbi:hypothetical protein [uncultured Sneathiella sp.]|uniref:hypothetical protein n=1 Tax=uncultured Sneathiella sp. TaxID=879315 RepID=UPI0025965CBC|nr:hypothetical protein [uncultured Sneathiella sp.]